MGDRVLIKRLEQTDPLFAEAKETRDKLIAKLSDFDEDIANRFLLEEPIDASTLKLAIKRAIISNHDKLCVTFVGR